MPWNWFQDKDSSFLRERSAGGHKTGIGVAQSGIGIDARAVGADSRPRCGPALLRPDKVPGGGNPAPDAPPPDRAEGSRPDAARPPLPRAERAAQAETGIGVGFPGIGLGGGAARCATFASDGREHRRCGRPTRNFCTHLTSHRPAGIRCRSAAGLLTAGLSSTVRPTHEKTNSHECKTPYANRPAGGCGDASARARTPCPAKCPAKHNTDNHG